MSTTDASTAQAQGFLSHLIELRDRLLRAVIAVGVIFFALFPFSKEIYNWLAAPLADQNQQMIITGTIAPFLVPMKLTLLVAFLIALPYLLYQLWSFVAPGLYRHEKRLVYPLLASSVFLFYLGIAFVYFILLPMMFTIIPKFAPDVAIYSPDIGQYLDFTMMMFLAFGFGFEMPIATILLISTGMTTAESLKSKRPYVIVGAFILGMLLTPPDVISQIMLAVPMWMLFEVGLFFSKYFKVRIKEAEEAKEKIDAGDYDYDDTNNDAEKTSATPAVAADTLWEDDKYTYTEEEGKEKDKGKDDKDNAGSSFDNSIFDGYTEDDSFDTGSDTPDKSASDHSADNADDADNNETIHEEEKFFSDSIDFDEMTDEEMEAELDRIEAQEKAEKKERKKKKKALKKAKKRAKKLARKKAEENGRSHSPDKKDKK